MVTRRGQYRNLPINRTWALEIHGPKNGVGVYTEKPFVAYTHGPQDHQKREWALIRRWALTRENTLYRERHLTVDLPETTAAALGPWQAVHLVVGVQEAETERGLPGQNTVDGPWRGGGGDKHGAERIREGSHSLVHDYTHSGYRLSSSQRA